MRKRFCRCESRALTSEPSRRKRRSYESSSARSRDASASQNLAKTVRNRAKSSVTRLFSLNDLATSRVSPSASRSGSVSG